MLGEVTLFFGGYPPFWGSLLLGGLLFLLGVSPLLGGVSSSWVGGDLLLSGAPFCQGGGSPPFRGDGAPLLG